MAGTKDRLIAEALELVGKGQFGPALRCYREAATLDVRDHRVWIKVGDLALRLGRASETIEAYQHAAELFREEGAHTRAIALYKQMLQLDVHGPQQVRTHERLGELYREMGLIPDALEHYTTAEALYRQAGDRRAALAAFKQVVELDPANTAARVRLGELYSTEGMKRQAADELAKAAEQLRAEQRTDEYMKVAERLLFLAPDNRPVSRELARLYLERGDARRALLHLQACYQANPREAPTLELLADAFEALGQPAKSLAVLETLARQLDESGTLEEQSRVRRRIARLQPDHPAAQPAVTPPPLPSTQPAEAPRRRPPPPPPPKSAVASAVPVELPPPLAEPLPDPEPLLVADPLVRPVVVAGPATVEASIESPSDPRPSEPGDSLAPLAKVSPHERITRELVRARATDGRASVELREATMSAGGEERAPAPSASEPAAEVPPMEAPAPEVSPVEEAKPAALDDELEEADFYAQQGMLEEARELLRQLLARHPGHRLVASKLRELEAAMAPDTISDEAAGNAAGDAPSDVTENVPMSVIEAFAAEHERLTALAEPPASSSQVRQSGAVDGDYASHFDLGIAYREMGLIDDAIAEFKRAMGDSARAIQCHQMLGLCYLAKGQTHEAVHQYKLGLYAEGIQESEQLSLYYDLGQAYERLGDRPEALYYYQRIIKRASGYRDVDQRIAALAR